MTTEAQLRDFIARHRLLLSRERDEEVQRSSLLLSNCGPKLLEQKGLALNGLGVACVNIGLGGKTLVELERPSAYHTSPIFPPHTFRPGDLACIEENTSANSASKKIAKARQGRSRGEAEGNRGVHGVVYKVSDTRIVLAVDPNDSSDDLDLPERCRLVKLANSVTYDRMEKALNRLESLVLAVQQTAVPTRLIQVLLGLSSPSEPSLLQTPIVFLDPGLNHSQRVAVQFALEAKEVACIHGPPGTGKTRTLVEIVRQLVARANTPETDAVTRAQKILICSASNLAVDNILERLLLLPENLCPTRVGHPARVMIGGLEGRKMLEATLEVRAGKSEQAALAKDAKSELETALGILSGKGKGQKGKAPRGAERKKMWEEVRALRKEYREREGTVVKTVLAESQIILATCHSSGGRQLSNHEFDVVIIDEATQALEAVCWIPILRSKKLILAGDPMQLPPTILSLGKKQKRRDGVKEKKRKPLNEPKLLSKGADAKDQAAVGGPPAAESSDETDEDQNQSQEDVAGPEPTQDEGQKKHRLGETGGKEKKIKTPALRPPRTLETTLFDRLEHMYGPCIKRMLDEQYRMHESICAFPSQTLYSSKLTSHQSVSGHLLRDLPEVKSAEISEEELTEVLGTPVIFFDTHGCEYFERADGDGDEGSRCNENEAALVNKWVNQLVGMGVLPSQIAVITPYQAQVTLLTSLLRPVHGPQLEIGTVDGMQGREKEAVIISLVRSNEKKELGFLKEKRRLNVAMTRARRHLCIIGDSSMLSYGGPYLKDWLTWLEGNTDIRYAENE